MIDSSLADGNRWRQQQICQALVIDCGAFAMFDCFAPRKKSFEYMHTSSELCNEFHCDIH